MNRPSCTPQGNHAVKRQLGQQLTRFPHPYHQVVRVPSRVVVNPIQPPQHNIKPPQPPTNCNKCNRYQGDNLLWRRHHSIPARMFLSKQTFSIMNKVVGIGVISHTLSDTEHCKLLSLEKKEHLYIHKFKTLYPVGLNKNTFELSILS